MKQVSIDNLKENDILALPILSQGEAVLIHADVVLTHELIERVRNLGTKTVYIKDEVEGVAGESASEEHGAEEEGYPYKVEQTAKNSKQVVKRILEKHIYKHNEELKVIVEEAQRILDSVLSEPEVVKNITEIRNVSTDMYTHCINVCALSTIMALRLKMSDKQVHNVSMGAILHDIGLRYINVSYINISENQMTIKDAAEYKKHTIYGYSSLQDEAWLSDTAKEIVLFHHERIDGSGYPFQHRGERLKPEVKLVSVCDDFDSMISGIGSEKMKIYEAIEYIKVHAGTKYDPTITSKFLESVAAYPVGCTVITNGGEKGVVIRQNKEAADRPVIRMTEHADGTPFTENVEYNLMKQLTMFIVDTE